MSRTNFHSSKDVRAIEVRLYINLQGPFFFFFFFFDLSGQHGRHEISAVTKTQLKLYGTVLLVIFYGLFHCGMTK